MTWRISGEFLMGQPLVIDIYLQNYAVVVWTQRKKLSNEESYQDASYIYIHVYNISPRLCQHSPGFYMRLCHEDGKGHMFFPSGWILSVTCTSSWLLARYFAVLFPWKAEFWESQMHLAPWTTPFCWQLNELPLRILKILNSQHFFRLIPCHTGKILVFICWFGLIKILYLHLC